MKSHFSVTILAGGKGTRLWPLSTARRPKPFVTLGLVGRLFDLSVERALLLNPPLITTIGVGSLEGLSKHSGAEFLAEPAPRNTAAAVALAALNAEERTGIGNGLLVMPADHFIGNLERFVKTVHRLAGLCSEEKALGVMGIRPTEPSSAYGYVTPGKSVGEGFRLGAFVEKPDRPTAIKLIEDGAYWNSGIFYFPLEVLRVEMERFCGDYPAAASAWLKEGRAEPYEALRSTSIDYALMEKSDNVVMAPADFAWSDVGTYPSLHALLPKDEHGNSGWGPGTVVDCRDCLVVTRRREALVRGFEHCVIIEREEGLLSVPMDEADKIRHDVETILESGGGNDPAKDGN